MAQHKFKIEQVDQSIMIQLEANHATAYFSAMCFQLGCAIGELIGMGVSPDEILNSVDKLLETALVTRLSVDTKDEVKG